MTEYNHPFEYNKCQKAVLPFIKTDSNLIISFATATGKTALAELAIYKTLCENKKVIYIAPLKSLIDEKFVTWSEDSQLGAICVRKSRDYSPTKEEYDAAGIILTTIEGFSFISRSSHEFLDKVGLIVIDEAHYIGHIGRGSSLEGALTLFCVRYSPRLVLLSATMSNSDQMCKWCKTLNGRKSLCFHSLWRPNKFEVVFHYADGWILNEVVREVLVSDVKTLVFVQSKKFGKELVKAIRARGKSCAFHNASVGKEMRKKMEVLFADPSSSLNCLVCTSTLGAGTNL